MLFRKRLIVLMALVSFLVFPSASYSFRDISDFHLDGIRLGMTLGKVKQVLGSFSTHRELVEGELREVPDPRYKDGFRAYETEKKFPDKKVTYVFAREKVGMQLFSMSSEQLYDHRNMAVIVDGLVKKFGKPDFVCKPPAEHQALPTKDRMLLVWGARLSTCMPGPGNFSGPKWVSALIDPQKDGETTLVRVHYYDGLIAGKNRAEYMKR